MRVGVQRSQNIHVNSVNDDELEVYGGAVVEMVEAITHPTTPSDRRRPPMTLKDH